jgi:hypothetical protein
MAAVVSRLAVDDPVHLLPNVIGDLGMSADERSPEWWNDLEIIRLWRKAGDERRFHADDFQFGFFEDLGLEHVAPL